MLGSWYNEKMNERFLPCSAEEGHHKDEYKIKSFVIDLYEECMDVFLPYIMVCCKNQSHWATECLLKSIYSESFKVNML